MCVHCGRGGVPLFSDFFVSVNDPHEPVGDFLGVDNWYASENQRVMGPCAAVAAGVAAYVYAGTPHDIVWSKCLQFGTPAGACCSSIWGGI